MLIFANRTEIERALTLDTRPALAELLREHARHTLAGPVADFTTIIVLECSDPERALATALGGSLLVSALDGSRFGARNFQPDLDWLRARDGWHEAVQCIGDGGFANIILIENRPDELGAMCRKCAGS